MSLIHKAILFYKKEGFRNTFARTFQKVWEVLAHVPGNLWEKIAVSHYRKLLLPRVTGKQVYVVTSCIDWTIPLFQRPHQIAQVLSRRENTHVLFLSPKQKYDNFAGVMPVSPGLDVVSERILPELNEVLKQAETVTVFKSWPRDAHLLDAIPYDRLVYEYIDDFSLFYYYDEALSRKHEQLMREADVTVCTAKALYEAALPVAKKAVLSPNAGDFDFFYDNRNVPAEPGLARKVKPYDCVLGYYGSLASWFDYDLVLEVAKKKPNWCFVLVGHSFDGTVSRLTETKAENVILCPPQPYQNLPPFIASFDIQTIPFLLNDITRATSPVKLFEYMATGKPILTSAMPECLQYASVTTYSDADDFIAKAEALLAKRDDPDYQARLLEEAKANTWDSRVTEILNILNGDDVLCAPR